MRQEKRVQQYVEGIDVRKLGLEETVENPIITGSYSGESNKIYFIRFGSNQFVLKLNGVGGKDPEFFEREYHKLNSLQEFKIAPLPYIYDENSLGNQSMILEMIGGETLRGKEVGPHLEQILASLNKMIEIPAEILRDRKGFKRDINSCWDYVHMFPAHAQRQLTEYLSRAGEDEIYKLSKKATGSGLKKIQEEKDSFVNSEMGLIHTGLHPENIVYTPAGQIRFIDWEHSSVGDGAFEISSLLRSNSFSEREIEIIFERYSGQTGDFRSRVKLYTDLFKVHEVLWHALRFDKAKKEELNLSQNKTADYYQNLLNRHLENLKNSDII